jgi:hypothetical protein
MSRPGTNSLLGGDGTMNNACMHGSTFDGRVVQRTSDDGFNTPWGPTIDLLAIAVSTSWEAALRVPGWASCRS